MNPLQIAVINYLLSLGWTKGDPSKGWGESTVIKIEGASKKQCNICKEEVKFFFNDKHIYISTAVEILEETNSLLYYFISE